MVSNFWTLIHNMSRSGKMTKNKKLILIVLGILVGICALVGVSYALWVANFSQTNENLVLASCFQIEFREDTQSISLQNTFPITDEDGKKLTPYTFTITNTCEAYASYQVNLEVLNTSTLRHYEYIKVALDDNISLLSNNEVVQPTLDNASTSFKLTTGYLDHNESVTYNLRLWIDENVTLESEGILNTTFASKITITASYIDHMPSDYEICVGRYGEDSTNCQIIAEAMSDEGSCPTLNEDGSVVVSNIEGTNSYVCSAPDNYGNSYYFRGNVTNNYVKFGKNEQGQDMYWRIIRINGDGSIRLIYDGTSAHANGEVVRDDNYRSIGDSRYNSTYNDNAYVGYMYGTPGSSSYAETHANTNDSTIKSYLDDWYENVFSGTPYESYIVDNLFCNDRSLLHDTAQDYAGEQYSNLGYGKERTAYRWYGDPLAASMGEDYANLLTYPNLQCAEQNDRFTVSDEVIGNGALTYPIGLITTDEVYLAGGFAAENYDYYLYTGDYYWTMSPVDFGNGAAFVRRVYSGGSGRGYDYVYSLNGVRPTLNLIPDSLKVGSGTAADPYMVG